MTEIPARYTSSIVGRSGKAIANVLIFFCVILSACNTFVALGAQQQVNHSHHFGPDSCGPVDPVYIRIANETGGQPLFLQPDEAAKAVQFMRESSGENHVTLVWAGDKLGANPREFTVPVDSTIERITFSLSADTKGTTMAVFRPSGSKVVESDSGVEITKLNCGRFVSVPLPEAGDWRIQIAGKGRFWFQAQGKSEIFFVSVEFVKPGGRPGHEGLFRIAGQPLADAPATLQANLSGPFKSAGFSLVSEAGEITKPIDLRLADSADDSHEYAGEFMLPATPFRVAVAGINNQGQSFQRTFHTLFHAERVEVSAAGYIEDVPPGKTTSLTFQVRNVGPPATFRIIAADGRRFITRVNPQELTLSSGSSGKVTVDVTIPANIRVGTGFDVTVTATSMTSPATANGTSLHLSVFNRQAP